MEQIINIENLGKKFKEFEAVRDVSLCIEAGKLVETISAESKVVTY